jgi:hypothetical protein
MLKQDATSPLHASRVTCSYYKRCRSRSVPVIRQVSVRMKSRPFHQAKVLSIDVGEFKVT